jgi:hypothetical protein
MPVLKYQFDKSWKPKQDHKTAGAALGLTVKEVVERARDCRLKAYPRGFVSEDDQFSRELTWAARDKETNRFKEMTRHERYRTENPGADRRGSGGESTGPKAPDYASLATRQGR